MSYDLFDLRILQRLFRSSKHACKSGKKDDGNEDVNADDDANINVDGRKKESIFANECTFLFNSFSAFRLRH